MYNKIIEKAEAEASRIKENGELKARKLTDELLNETQEKINQMVDEAKIKNADLIKTKTAEFDQTLKQQVLSNQKELIKETFDYALKKLVKMNDEELKKFIIISLHKSGLTGDVVLKVNKDDYNRYYNIIKKVSFDNMKLTLSSESANIKGGFIIEGKYFDLDNSYEVILKNLSEELETKIAQMLFKNEA